MSAGSDSRSAAWLAAFERLDAANELKADRKGKPVDPLPEWYWSLLAEARIFAELAKSSMEVGLATGDWLRERDRQESVQRSHIEDLLAKRREGESA